MMFRDGAKSTNGNSVMDFVQTKYENQSESYPDIKLCFTAHEARCSEMGVIDEIFGDVGLVDGNIPKRKAYMQCIFVRPKSKENLTLRDNDPQTYPKLFAGYPYNSEDDAPLIEGIKFLVEPSKADALKKYDSQFNQTSVPGCEEHSFGSDEYWTYYTRRETFAIFHHTGTCKMGPDSDPEAVVDHVLRVKGVCQLRVVDFSVIPKADFSCSFTSVVMI